MAVYLGSNQIDMFGGNGIVQPTLQTKTINPSESIQNIVADSGYDGLDEVIVQGIPLNYVGSGIDQRDSTDLTTSGATVIVPEGYYENETSKTIASGSAGTPVATKGTVSNHAISITPSVTNSTGYITGSTKTGTAVSVAASELVSGSQTVTKNNTYDVTNLAQMVVNVAGGFEYEAGSFTPTSNVASRSVNFSKTHTKPPAIAMCFDVSQTAPTQNRTGLWICGDVTEIVRAKIGPHWYESWSANVSGFLILWQAYVYGTYNGVSGAKRWATGLAYGNADTSQTSALGTRYYMNETRLNIAKYSWGSDCDAVLEANHKYVWLAIWVPDDWTQPT